MSTMADELADIASVVNEVINSQQEKIMSMIRMIGGNYVSILPTVNAEVLNETHTYVIELSKQDGNNYNGAAAILVGVMREIVLLLKETTENVYNISASPNGGFELYQNENRVYCKQEINLYK